MTETVATPAPTFAPGAIADLLLDKVKGISADYVDAKTKHDAATSTDVNAILASLMLSSDDAAVVKARETIAKAEAAIVAAREAANSVLAPLAESYKVSEKDAALLAAKVKESRKQISDLVNAGEVAEPGFKAYVGTLDIPGVKSASTGTNAGTGGIKPRVSVSVGGTEILDENTGRSSFTAAAKFLSTKESKVSVTDLQAAWVSASGISNAAEIVEPVTFDFNGNTVLVVKRAA